MRVQVQKWGNSLALRIPKPFAEEAAVKEGTVVDVFVSEGRIVAAPVAAPAVSLNQLLKRITKQNMHGEQAPDGPVGREVW